MTRPRVHYREGQAYIFVSYSHEDSEVVYSEMSRLSDAGFNIWYDEDISPGESWRDEVAHAIENCALFLVFISHRSVESQHCLQEVSFALTNDRTLLAVYLEDTELSGGLAMSLLDRQAIFMTRYDEEEYRHKLHEALQTSIQPSPSERAVSEPIAQIKETTFLGGWPNFGLAVGLVSVLAVATYWYTSRDELTEADIIPDFEKSLVASGASIAVLPFSDMSSTSDQAYFGDGIAEEVLNRLTRIRDLKVISRTSSFGMRNTELRASQIGERIGAEFILEGSIRRTGNEVRVTAQLIQAASDTHVWSETYTAALDDLFGIQDKIAQAIVYKIKRKVASASTFETPPPTTVMSAYDAFLIGMTAKHSGQEPEAILHFERAVSLDPNFAEVYLGLSWAHWQLIVKQGLQPDLLQKQVVYAEKAYSLKPDSPQIVGALCRARLAQGRWIDAERLCLEALQLNPKMVSVVRTYCWLLLLTGRKNEYVRVAEGHNFNWETYMTAQYYLNTEQYGQLMRMGPVALEENLAMDLLFILYGALATRDRDFLARFVEHVAGAKSNAMEGPWPAVVAQVLDRIDAKEVMLGPNTRVALEAQAQNLDRAFELISQAVPIFMMNNEAIAPLRRDARWQSYLEDRALNDSSNHQLYASSDLIKEEINYIDPWY